MLNKRQTTADPGLIDFHPHWTIALFILGLPVSEPVHSRVGQAPGCPGPDLHGYISQSYATDRGATRRCGLLADIERYGALEPGDLRVQILDELSKRFAIRIEFKGEVGLPRRAVDYLLHNMPEAAALVSVYSGKDYRATETNIARSRDRFFVTNNDTFAARFTFLRSREGPHDSEHMFFESGFAKVLFWRVWGNSFIDYRLSGTGASTSRYDIDVHVFTGSRLLRTVLNTGLFRYFAQSMFDGILDDIESAVGEFSADSNPGESLPPYFVMGLKNRLQPAPGVPLPRERRISSQHGTDRR